MLAPWLRLAPRSEACAQPAALGSAHALLFQDTGQYSTYLQPHAGAFSLAVATSNGNLQLMKDDRDEHPVIVDTGTGGLVVVQLQATPRAWALCILLQSHT